MAALPGQLDRFFPNLLLERLASLQPGADVPTHRKFLGVALFLDISGFTPLTEAMAQQGSAGVDQLANLLDIYFRALIEVLHAHGGDVVQFVGDALWAVWSTTPDGLSLAVGQAAACALAIRDSLNGYEVYPAIDFHLRLVLAAGELFAVDVAATEQQRTFMIGGAPFDQIRDAAKHAEIGELVVSAQACSALAAWHPEITQSNGVTVVRRLKLSPPSAPLHAVTFPETQHAILRRYLPALLPALLDSTGSEWLPELRPVITVFCSVTGLDYDGPESAIRLQRAIGEIYVAAKRFEGTVTRVAIDDKGTIALIVFGLPSQSHEDDAVRATRSAIEIRRRLDCLGISSALGVASGSVFCGIVGGAQRCDYTVYGDGVNLAARLMQAARDSVYCDQTVFTSAKDMGVVFFRLPSTVLKGKSRPIAVYRVLADEAEARLLRRMVGRPQQMQHLRNRLDALRRGIGAVTIIEGEPGIGKSRLISELIAQAKTLEIPCYCGSGDAIEKSTAFHAWREIFQQILRLDVPDTAAGRRDRVISYFKDDTELLRLAPLLNGILPLGMEDSDFTASLTADTRLANTRHMLLRILQMQVAKQPSILLFEDIHWMDSASWALLETACRDIKSMFVVLAARPTPGESANRIVSLINNIGAERLAIGALSREETNELLARCLGVSEVSAPLTMQIFERAVGHPFFSEELAFAMRDSGMIILQGQAAVLSPEAENLSQFALPDSVQGVIRSRLDRLSLGQQLELKVASVIGQIFAVRLLQDIAPPTFDRQTLDKDLDSICLAQLIAPYSHDSDLSYIFSHIITREVVYSTLTQSQRRQLHASVVSWYERTAAENLHLHYPLLSHHAINAGDTAKAVDYLEKSARQALGNGADREAIHFVELAWTMSQPSPVGTINMRRAEWERICGEAYYSLGELHTSEFHFVAALQLLQREPPDTKPGLYLKLVVEVGIAIRDLLLGRHQRTKSGAFKHNMNLVAPRVHERLSELNYLRYRLGFGAMHLVAGLNTAVSQPLSPELSRALATASVLVSFTPLQSLTGYYARKAHSAAAMLSSPVVEGEVNNFIAVVHIGRGEWEIARDLLSRAGEEFRRIKAWRQLGQNVTLLSELNSYCGNFEQSERYSRELSAIGRDIGNRQFEMWSFCGPWDIAIKRGTIMNAVPAARQSEESTYAKMFENQPYRLAQRHCVFAIEALENGDTFRAHAEGKAALSIVRDTVALGFWEVDFSAYLPEICFAIWEKDGPSAEIMRDAALAVSLARRFARMFPIGVPGALRARAKLAWLKGNSGTARRLWRSSLRVASRLDMPYDIACAEHALGVHSGSSTTERRAWLENACKTFEKLGAKQPLERARAKLASMGKDAQVTR